MLATQETTSTTSTSTSTAMPQKDVTSTSSSPSWDTTRLTAVKVAEKHLPDPKRVVYVALDGSKHATNALNWAIDNVYKHGEDHLVLLTICVLDLDISDVLQETFDKLFGAEDTAGRSWTERAAMEQGLKVLKDAEAHLLDRKLRSDTTATPSYELVAIASDDPEGSIIQHVRQKDDVATKRVEQRPEWQPGESVLVVGSRGLGMLNRLLMGSVSDYLVRYSPVPVVVVRDSTRSE
ncbi:hypothetical protein HDU96_009093 [Phlyctochytrium bullatum]|nr:hypothetical protein HDU96_009093 [Phlyctochytrium bullatum]